MLVAVVKDWRGTEIQVGSTVVYPSRQGSRLWMTEGEVVSLPLSKKDARIGVRAKGSRRTAFPDPNRITVV